MGMAARTKTAIVSIADLKAEDLPALRAAFNALPGVENIDLASSAAWPSSTSIRLSRTSTTFCGQY